MLLTRIRAVLVVSTFWAAAWVVVGLALVARLALESTAVPSRIAWLTSIVVPLAASIGFDSGAAFSVALLILSAGGVRDARLRLGSCVAATVAGSLASGRLGLEPTALTTLVCGSCAAACAAISLDIASGAVCLARSEHV